MVEAPNLYWFGWFLWLGGTVFVLAILGSRQREAGAESAPAAAMSYEFDPLLRRRFETVQLNDWNALQRKSGLTPRSLLQARRGKLEKLTLEELQNLASTLQWSLEELLSQYNRPLPQLSHMAAERATLQQQTEQLQQELLALKQQLANEVDRVYRAHQQTAQLQQQLTEDNEALQSKRYELDQLQQQCRRLRADLEQQSTQLTADVKDETFRHLQTLLMNYPTAAMMAEARPTLPAKNLVPLFAPLQNLLSAWGYEPIGSAWEQVLYDPQLHQADSEQIAVGDLVYVRFVGYREGDRILCPAKVSRTLPRA
ncbi:MAG: XRE family transcriptional regulator [Spirulinaceae cyanobacterium SM2_1_0]|nr:XRE family transcriptional regulator [Spirulinaceae cyanobacterium SM2_1_0]